MQIFDLDSSPVPDSRPDSGSGVFSAERAARSSCFLFFACGALVVALPLLMPLRPGASALGITIVGLSAVALGAAFWTLPWARMKVSSTYWMVPPALVVICLFNHFAREPYLYAVFFLVVAVWIGMVHQRGVAAWSSPLLAAAYLAPALLTTGVGPEPARALFVLLPVWILVGEAAAWMSIKLRQAEAAHARAEARFASLVRNADEFVLIVSAEGEVTYASPAVERVLGRAPGELEGRSYETFVHPTDLATLRSVFRDLDQRPAAHRELEYRMRHGDGSWRWIEGSSTDLFDDVAVAGMVLNGRDVTWRLRMEQDLAHRATHDELTGLPNRSLLLSELAAELETMGDGGGFPAVLLCDLDDFKLINDTYGHAEGDQLLRAVAQRLCRIVGSPHRVAKFGGDDFVVLCRGLATRAESIEIAKRIHSATEEPFRLEGRLHHVSVSIGVCVPQSPRTTPEDLLRDADVALLAARECQGARLRVFDADLRRAIVQQAKTAVALRRAVERSELECHFQPQVALPSGRVVGAEALLRWRDPEAGLVAPRDFLQVAEDTRLIVPIGEWMLRQVCTAVRTWGRNADGSAPRVALNLSAQQLIDPGLPEKVASAVGAAGIDPAQLCLEITESTLLRDLTGAAARLAELKQIGVTIALDDFGTGFSSLTYLRRLPIDQIKIDRSFVAGLGSDADDRAIVASVIDLARRLRREVVAEGVETRIQHENLTNLGCDRAQGHLYGRAAPRVSFSRRRELPFEEAQPSRSAVAMGSD